MIEQSVITHNNLVINLVVLVTTDIAHVVLTTNISDYIPIVANVDFATSYEEISNNLEDLASIYEKYKNANNVIFGFIHNNETTIEEIKSSMINWENTDIQINQYLILINLNMKKTFMQIVALYT